MRFGIECKHLLWAFTFLCQFGFHCPNLALTWGGLGPVLCAASWNLPVERRVLRRWPGERLGVLSEVLSAPDVIVPDRGDPSQEDGLEANGIFGVPW